MAKKAAAPERGQMAEQGGAERTRSRAVSTPRVDIIESEQGLDILADMPGVTKDSVEVTLEQRVLTIRGRTEISLPEGLAPLHLEYEPGDYERSFTLSDAVDPNRITARVKGGVLALHLPKAEAAKRQRIEVQAD